MTLDSQTRDTYMDDIYGGGRKSTWRGWMWNRICERIPKHDRSSAVVVCLAGPEDRDRPEAIKRGFVNHNVISVDIHQGCVEKSRENGGLAIRGDLKDVLRRLSLKIPVSVVVADLMCGLDARVKDLIKDADGVWALNLQRGRDEVDAISPYQRETPISEVINRDRSYWMEFFDWSGVPPRFRTPKHRGFVAMCDDVFHRLDSIEFHDEWTRRHLGSGRCARECSEFRDLRPQLYSYRSERGALYFDTVVFSGPDPRDTREFRQANKRVQDRIDRTYVGSMANTRTGRNAISTKRKCAALLAVRTKKIQAAE